jgi:outer membrane protein assembly factor BamB
MKNDKLPENLLINDKNGAIVRSIIEKFRTSSFKLTWELSINEFLEEKNVRINSIVIGIVGTIPERIYIGSNTKIILVFDLNGKKVDEIEIDYETEIIGLYIANVTEEFSGNNLVVSTSDNSIIFFEAEDGENYRELSETIDERQNDITAFFPLCRKESYDNKFLLLGYSSGEVKSISYDNIRDKDSIVDIIKAEDIIDREEIVGICGSFNLLDNKTGIVVAYRNGALFLYDENYQLIVKHDLKKAINKLFYLESGNTLLLITDEYEIAYFSISPDGFHFIWNYRLDSLGTAIVPDGDGNFYVLFEDSGLIYRFNKAGNVQFTSDPSINGTSGQIWSNNLYIASNEGEVAKYEIIDSEGIKFLINQLHDSYTKQLNSLTNEDEFAIWFNEEFEQPDREPYFIEYLNECLEKDLLNEINKNNIIYLFANKKYDTEIASGLKEKIRSSCILKDNFIRKFSNTVVASELEGYEAETIIEIGIEKKAEIVLLDNPDASLSYVSLMEKLRINKVDVLWKNKLVDSDDIIDVAIFHDPFLENETQILVATKKGIVALIDKTTGVIIWNFKINMDDGIINNILVTDICHDERKEIILGLENCRNSIIIITESNTKYDGNKINFNLQKLNLVWGDNYPDKDNYSLFQAHCYSPGIANKTVHKVSSFDFDKDGLDDLVISSENGSFNVFYFDRDARQNIKTSKIQIIENEEDENEDILDFCFVKNPDDSITLYTGSQTGKIEKHNFNGTKFEKEKSILSAERYGKDDRITDILITEINKKRCIIFSSEDNFVYCLYENLEYKWSFKATGNITSLTLSEIEGKRYIFCASDDNNGNLIALDLAGNKVWDFPFYNPLQKIFSYDNFLIIADSDGFIYLAKIISNKDLANKIELAIKENSIDNRSLLTNHDEFLRIYACRKLIEMNHFTDDSLADLRIRISDTYEFTSRVRREIVILIANSVLASSSKQNLLELLIKPILDEDNSEEVRLESVKSFIRFIDLYKSHNFDFENILHLIAHDKDEYVKAFLAGELGQLFLNNKEMIDVIWSTTKHFIEVNIEEDWVISETFNSIIKIINYTDDVQVINYVIREVFELEIENDIYSKFKKKIFNRIALTLFEIYESIYLADIFKLGKNVQELNLFVDDNGIHASDKGAFISFKETINLTNYVLIEDNLDELIKDKYLFKLIEKYYHTFDNLNGIIHSLKEYSVSINNNEKIRIISQIQQDIKEFAAIKAGKIQSKFDTKLLSLTVENKLGNLIEDNLIFLLESVNLEIEIIDKDVIINKQGFADLCLEISNSGFKKVEGIEIIVKEDSHYKVINQPDYSGDLLKAEQKTVYLTIKPQITIGKLDVYINISYKNCKQNIIKKIQIIVREELITQWVDIPDIFKSGMPVEDNRIFVGRESQIKEIINSIEKGESVFVMGHRRMGKTSLINYVLRNYLENNDKYIPVFISAEKLEYSDTNWFLYSLFTIGSSFDEILVEKGIFEKEYLESKLDAIKKDGLREYTDLFSKILKKIKSLHKILVFVIDEYPMIHENIMLGNVDSGFTTKLRGYLQHDSSEFNIIYSGASSLKYIRSDYSSNIMGVGNSVEAGFFNEAEVNMLISKPLNNLLKFDPSAYNYLMDLTSGHPYFTQLILDLLVKKFNTQKSGYTVFKENIEEILPPIIDKTGYLSSFWDKGSDKKENESNDIDDISLIIKSKDLKWNENDIKLASAYKHLIISYIADNWIKYKNGVSYESINTTIQNAIRNSQLNRIIFDEVLLILTSNEDILLFKNNLYFIKVGLFREWVISKNLTFDKVKANINDDYPKGGENE